MAKIYLMGVRYVKCNVAGSTQIMKIILFVGRITTAWETVFGLKAQEAANRPAIRRLHGIWLFPTVRRLSGLTGGRWVG